MIDSQALDTLIEQQVKLVVEQKIQSILEQTDWVEHLEQRIVSYAQDRIVSRFANISTVPDLIQTVQTSVSELFNQGRIPNLSTFVDQTTLNSAIDNGIQQLVTDAIDNLVVDPSWIKKVEQITNQNMADKLTRKLHEVDLNSLIVANIDSGIERWQDRLKKDFRTNGIVDNSTKTEISVHDDNVTIENQLTTNNLLVTTDAEIEGSLVVNNFFVRGKINTDNKSWKELATTISAQVLDNTTDEWKQVLVDQVLSIAKTSGIDFDSVMLNGKQIVNNNVLNPSITESNIQVTGVLKELIVAGSAKFGNTMHVAGHRVGINTEAPEMALSVWDEEVSILAGKLSKQQGYVGTARLQNLAIGINRVPQIEIDISGLTTIKQLRVGRHRLSHATEVPGYSGTRGDFVFNANPADDAPFAWVCLGSFQWKPLFSK